MTYWRDSELARQRAERDREAYLRSLPEDERMRLRKEDGERAEAEADARAEARRHDEQRQRISGVVDVWQRLQGHQLSEQRRFDFENHPCAEALTRVRTEILKESGSFVMAGNDGELRLAEWLPAAEEALKLFYDAVDAASAKRADELKDLPELEVVPKCPNCGLAYRWNGACLC